MYTFEDTARVFGVPTFNADALESHEPTPFRVDVCLWEPAVLYEGRGTILVSVDPVLTPRGYQASFPQRVAHDIGDDHGGLYSTEERIVVEWVQNGHHVAVNSAADATAVPRVPDRLDAMKDLAEKLEAAVEAASQYSPRLVDW